ncbi:C1 family peptidase [Flavobacterium sp.]|uniref:C1 family peptidase n=1 Tax=Flavobacterium sp. TaxID=239 RepID=UPI002B4AE4AA|nr:C1 family peptidase [Flavobacterium sp.]HLP64816.1 C1 family peptidase [Flavobacterium sp.]
MKKSILFGKKIVLLFALSTSAICFSQKYDFQTVTEVPCLPVISQDNTGTCWSFSSTSFLESEILRITGKPIDLSEMYSVRQTYPKKALNYVMRQGKAQFGEGGLNHDVINSALEYGLVPESAYSGRINGPKLNHSKMVKDLEDVLNNVVKNPVKLAGTWKSEYEAILDQNIGKPVTEFTFEGKQYTPKQFLEATQLKLADYITITSFTHEPYYSKFILNIPDNFANGTFMNLPLDEFIENIDNALKNGYTVALDADVSEKTFSKIYGIAVVPENENDATTILTEIKPEKKVTPELRQAEFENYNTTDDHLMHIVGKMKDQKGTIYYKVKNSWGTDNAGHNGYIYMSAAYMKLKAISVMVHKDALLSATRSLLGI